MQLSNKAETLDQLFSISSQGNLSVKISSETTYFSIASSHTESKSESLTYELISSTEVESTESEHSLQLHIPIFNDAEVEKDSKIALSSVISWIQSSQKASSTTTTTTVQISQRYGIFPQATWFFVKANIKGGDSLVLAVKNDSYKSGATLVLKKLSFKDYKSQLWTFRNGLLINYGSKLVVDVNDEINESSKVVQAPEACVSSQKWSLTANGRIQLESYSQYTFGFHKTETLVEDTEVILVANKESYEESSAIQAIVWKFSVPVFGTNTETSSTTTTSTTTSTTVSSIERISTYIENGALIESVEEAEIKVEDIFVKKSSAATNSSSLSTAVIQKEKHHGFQDILASVGIAVTAGAVAVASVEGVTKITDKISEHRDETKKVAEEKKQSSTSTVVKTQDQIQQAASNISTAVQGNATSAVTDVDKTTEVVIVRRSQRTSVQIIEESRVIIRAWKIVFSQRIHHCKSKAELVQTIEESREELFRRLDEYLRVHASVEHLVVGSVPEWHVSIHQVKELYRARVFDKFLGRLTNENISNVTELDFDNTLSSATEEVENHYNLVIENQSKILSESSTTEVQESQSTEVFIQENVLVTIDTIKVTVRYWLIGLYETISIARNKGSSEEEISVIIDDSRKELTTTLTQIKNSVSSHLDKSSSIILNSKKSSIINTIDTAITQTEAVISSQVTTMCAKKEYLVTEEHWLDITRTTEERLSGELKVYQTAITQEISDIQKTEITKSDQAEISIVLDEKMVVVAQQTVTNKLVETKTKISSWYTEVIQQINWLLEDSKTSSSSEEIIKQDTIAIIDAAQIEIATRIEETKLVVRTYYAHLTYLSWAERRRIEYSLDNVKASVTASIVQFKKSIEKSDVTKEQIIRYANYSFGATASRIVLTDIQTIVHKVTNVKETTTVVNITEQVKAENSKVGVVGNITSNTKVTEGKKTTQTKQEDVAKKTETTKVDEVKKTEKVKVQDNTKVIDTIHTEVEETKVGKVDNKASGSTSNQQSTVESGSHHIAESVSTAVIGAAAAAMASAAIFHHYEGKETKQQEQKKQDTTSATIVTNVPVAVIEKPAITHTNVIVGKASETIHVDEQKTSSAVNSTKQEKSETLVVVYDQVQVIVREWLTTLNKRVYECAQKKGNHVEEEIDAIVYESQQQLVVEIEKAKRKTTTVIGTSQTSFHDTLSWVRSTVWKQAVEVKHIGYEVASSTETSTTHFQEQLETLKEATLQKVDVEIEKSKTSASVIHIVGHASSAVISVGKKFEGKDYSKASCGQSVEKSKVSVGVLIEDTRITVQHLFSKLINSVSERRKEGGENVQADIEVIIKESREEINSYILKSKIDFEKRLTAQHTSTEVSTSEKVDIELTNETVKKVQSTLEQIEESYLVQVTRVEEITTSTTITSEVEYTEKLAVISQETREKLNETLSVSETVIGHHIEVTAESSNVQHISTAVSKTEEKTSSDSNIKVSLGVEYGLLVVSETIKSVSSQISALVERVHHRVTIGSDNLEQDVTNYIETSDKELDLIFEQAKTKISYELSMVASHEKVEEKHFLSTIEAIRVSTKQRITQIQTVATVEKEESKTISKKLLQIAEESRHEVSAHYDSIKKTVTKQTEKVSQVVHNSDISHESTGSTQVVVSQEEEKIKQEKKQKEDHQSKIDLAKKVLAGSAAVAAGTAIAVEIAKKLAEHKEKTEKIEHTQKQTTVVIEDVQVQYKKWIATLTETVIALSKQTTVSTEDINVTVETSKAEFIEIIQKANSNEVITEKYQHQILTWIEETAIAQATRIQEIAVSSSTTAVNVESRLEVLEVSTTQEVELALEKCKHAKSSVTDFVGISVEDLQKKEAALLDIRSELVVVIQDVKSSLVTYFHEFTKSVVTRVQKGGDNVEKDVAILIANTRKDLSVYIENVKNTATKRLSALETKSSNSVISIAALSGIATAEIISVLKSSEEIIMHKVNRVHSSVWYIESNQDTTEIIESINTIESETTIEITEKIESSKYGFVTAINEHHKSGHVITEVTEHKDLHLQASLTVQEVKVTIREWLRNLAEQVSVCSQKGGSSEEIDVIVKKENDIIFEYLDLSVTKITETVKTEEYIEHLHSTVEKIKASITKTSSEIQVIGIESSSSTSTYGGFDKMTSVITQYEHEISETLVVYETKITSSTKTQETVADKTASSVVVKKDENKQQVIKQEVYAVVTVEYILSTVHTWLEELMVDVSEVSKREHNITVVTKEINSVVVDAKEYISAEFEMISKKIRSSKGDSAAVQELINILEWTRGMVLQSSSQIQQIGVNCGVSFSSTGGIEQMRPLVHATESQIIIAVGRCNKKIKIDVERSSAHSEKHKVVSNL